jgi:hypothetical protein
MDELIKLVIRPKRKPVFNLKWGGKPDVRALSFIDCKGTTSGVKSQRQMGPAKMNNRVF